MRSHFRVLIEKNGLNIFLQIALQVALYYSLLVGYNMTEINIRNGIALIYNKVVVRVHAHSMGIVTRVD